MFLSLFISSSIFFSSPSSLVNALINFKFKWRGRGERLSGRPSAFSSPRVPDQTFSLGGGLARGERRKMMLRKRTSISRMSAKEITMGKIPAVLKE